ncbi:MAG TPA: nucleoside triphosphate pyrophosphohydrolase [Candidatus Methylomirabilis sp.]
MDERRIADGEAPPGAAFTRLVEVMARLRGEGGCPWDREQTRESLKPYVVEEAYEVLEAIDERDTAKLREELGDLLLQVVFQAQLAREAGEFTIAEVLQAIVEKLVRRHPHVFGDASATSAQEVLHRWEAIKRAERQNEHHRPSALDGVPRELPALLRAHRLQEKASRVGFDWDDTAGLLGKLAEELAEFQAVCRNGGGPRAANELGDLLFTLVNVARFLNVNPEEALRESITRFTRRFHHVEDQMHQAGIPMTRETRSEMDRLWEEAKAREEAGEAGEEP